MMRSVPKVQRWKDRIFFELPAREKKRKIGRKRASENVKNSLPLIIICNDGLIIF